jgi:hypothetical protein
VIYITFGNFLLFYGITSDSIHPIEPKVCESVITHLENLKTTTEGVILIDSVDDICVRSPFTLSLEQISYNDLAKDKLLDLCNNQELCFDFENKTGLGLVQTWWCTFHSDQVS